MAKNPHIDFIEFLNNFKKPENNLQQNHLVKFLEFQANLKLKATIRFPQFIPQEIERKLQDQALQNKRLTTTQNELPAVSDDVHTFETVSIPPTWYRVRPTLNHQEKLGIQYEHSLSQSTQHSTSIDTFSAVATQRMQQIQNQQQRQEQLRKEGNSSYDRGQILSLVSKNELYDKMYSTISIDFKKNYGSKEELTGYLENIWDSIIGKKIKAVDAISTTAMKVIVLYAEAFAGGIIEQNLPMGFYICQRDNQKILCYEQAQARSQEKSDLTAPLRNPRNMYITEGTANQFGLPEDVRNNKEFISAFKQYFLTNNSPDPQDRSSMDKKSPLLKILRHIDHDLLNNLHTRFSSIFEGFSAYNLFAMRSIILEKGTKKLAEFLNKLKLLEDKGLYDSYKQVFLDTSVN